MRDTVCSPDSLQLIGILFLLQYRPLIIVMGTSFLKLQVFRFYEMPWVFNKVSKYRTVWPCAYLPYSLWADAISCKRALASV